MRIMNGRPRGLAVGRSGRAWRAALLAVLVAGLMGVPVDAATGAGGWTSRLSVKVGGGAGLLGWGDVGRLKDSFERQVRYAADRFAIPTSGTCANPRLGWQGEVEIDLDVNDRLALGLAVGRFSRSGETVLNADWPPFLTSKHTWSQGSVITPVALSASWRLPLGARSSAYVRLGAGIASAVWKYKMRDEETIDFASWEQIEGTARDKGLLAQAGMGYEIRFGKRLAAFVEARGQFLSLGGWQSEHVHSTDASSETISAGLWLAEVAPSGGRPGRALLLASEFRPSAMLYRETRPVRLNFSGGTFLIGLRLKLGARPDNPTSHQSWGTTRGRIGRGE